MVIKLRWAVYKNSVTFQQVERHASVCGIGLHEAKRELVDKRGALEYLDENDQWWPVEQVEIIR